MDKAARFLSLKYTAKYTALCKSHLLSFVSVGGTVGTKLAVVTLTAYDL